MEDFSIARVECQSSLPDGSFFMTLDRLMAGAEPRCVINYWDLDTYTREKPRRRAVGYGYVEHRLCLLRESRIPGLLDEIAGCDGAHYLVEFEMGFNSCSYRWWGPAPMGYRPLVEFANDLLQVAGIRAHRIPIDSESTR
ncbi:hypothetical protein Tel_09185 [Candidatus Tenderia electrophaga]|jgi:hypothetical protein|uniref:Uncharacterized protein n=1 Tax=Candidatus Tenderia electrophaga TaxID=1748243 RepID=A0A0S2TDS0_9GAMM|nr:hypothetical protein Tel_09185 [Candidatus Tenderia electrophaga]